MSAKPTKQFALDTLAPLKGKTFEDREALEDAILPYYAPLENLFPVGLYGSGHRDFVDRLIDVGWITEVGCRTGVWKIILDEPQATPEVAPQVQSFQLDKKTKLTELKELFDSGLLPEDLYKAEVTRVLNAF